MVRGASTSGPEGRSAPNARSRTLRPCETSTPPITPSTAASTPEHERLGEHRAAHLPAAGTHRAQQRELAGALGDEHREGVEDEEDRDEQRDEREREQERVDELERGLEPLGDVGAALLTGLGARILRHDCGDSRGERVLRDTRVGPHRDARDLVVRLEQQRLGRGQVEDRQRRAVAARDAPRHQAGDHGLARCRPGCRCAPCRRPAPRRRRPSPRAARPAPRPTGASPEASVSGLIAASGTHVVPRAGGPALAHDLAVGPDHQRAVGRDDPVRRRHAVDGADLVHQRGRQRRHRAARRGSATRAAAGCARHAGRDDDVGLRRLEERVERLLQRVGEDEGARHERDADHDGEQR